MDPALRLVLIVIFMSLLLAVLKTDGKTFTTAAIVTLVVAVVCLGIFGMSFFR